MLHKLKFRFSEPYRISIGVGLSPLRTKREVRALIKFCRDQLEEEHIELSPKRKEIFETTVKYYDEYGHIDTEYVDENVGWYWS